MHIKFSTNMVLQVLAMIVQLANQLMSVVPLEYRELVTLIVGAIQSIIALIAHFSNPDGQTVKLPYKR